MNNQTDQYDKEIIYDQIIKTMHEDSSTISKETEVMLEKYLQNGEQGHSVLLDILIIRRTINKNTLIILDGIIFQYLKESKITTIIKKLDDHFPNGIVPLKDSLKINYNTLQNLLIEKKFQDADKLTQQYLCTLGGLGTVNPRQWLYFTDISFIPSDDLFTIDFLWKIYSKGKFGFSIQRKIWILNNNNWEKLWNQIGWREDGNMRRYPQEFIWNINAPAGHLPLFNQLRGNQVLFSLFEHIVWTKNISIS